MNERVVYKYTLEENETTLEMPVYGLVLRVDYQQDIIRIWYEHHHMYLKDKETVTFKIFGTGQIIDEEFPIWIGSVESPCGNFIWHVYRSAYKGKSR